MKIFFIHWPSLTPSLDHYLYNDYAREEYPDLDGITSPCALKSECACGAFVMPDRLPALLFDEGTQ